MGSSNQGFTSEEADAILKRAIDLQVEQSIAKSSTDGTSVVSLDQLYRSAAEAGIEASHVRQAADELAGRSQARSKSDPSEPAMVERVFQIEVKESDYPDLLELLRAETKSPGTGHVIGGSLEWQAFLVARREMLHVVVMPSEGVTRVKIRSSNPMAVASKFSLALPLVILVFAFVPMASFGFRFFQWTEVIPFATIAVVAATVPFLFGIRRLPWSKRSLGSEALMNSVALWVEHLRISRGGS